MRVLGLICARGGSKGVPRKNVRPLLGIPLIAYAIAAGRESRLVDRVVVSTDDEEIADVAKKHGADVPFSRPPELARDDSIQIDAIRHAIGWLNDHGDHCDVIALLQPTSPLRRAEDVDGAIQSLLDTGADSVISVMRVEHGHPKTLYRKSESNRVTPMIETDPAGTLRQDFEDYYWRNGAVYVMRHDVVMRQRSLYGADVRGYEMPPERSVNIDGPLDWLLAETLLRAERAGPPG
jgi:CMP-N,N'-diacetyllegionaminic acid synthase